jgi:hypothetical protein
MTRSSSSIRSTCDVIDGALARGVRNYIGGNCTVSLHADGAGRPVPARAWSSG